MPLDAKQRGVAMGMATGMALSITAVLLGPALLRGAPVQALAGTCLLFPALALMVAIARLAKHRFFTPQDIDGSGLGAGSDRAKLLQALLQNTLEQAAFAVPVYAAALFAWPDGAGRSAALCACLFLAGRILFFIRYEKGASARSLGFALTFYPTALLLLWQLGLLIATLSV